MGEPAGGADGEAGVGAMPGGEALRKFLHLGAGSGALLLRWTGWWGGLGMAAVGVAFNGWLLHRVTGGRILRAHERSAGASKGTILYPVMVFALILTLPGRLEIAAAAWGILAFGDAAAGAVGMRLGGPRLPWNPGKSWSGLVAFVVVATPVAAFLVRWTQGGVLGAPGMAGGAPGPSVGAGAGTAFGGAAAGAEGLLLVGCFLAAAVAGVAESLESAVDDNVLVPAAAALTLLATSAVEPEGVAAAFAAVPAQAVGLAVLAVPAVVALAAGAVTVAGGVAGWVLVAGLLLFGGWTAVLVFSAFFVVGTGATWMGHTRKEALGVAHARGGRRGATHALANAGAGLAFAFLGAAAPGRGDVWVVAMAAAFATAAFDTVASEVGQAYGRTHVVVGVGRGWFRRAAPGTEGAISLEGTLAGLAGAVLVAATAWGIGLLVAPGETGSGGAAVVGLGGALAVVLGAAAGSLAESVAGATLPSQRRADNGLLNLGATLVGAGAAVGIFALVG